jgi:hypothetical protein
LPRHYKGYVVALVNHGSGGRWLQIPRAIVLFFARKLAAEKSWTTRLWIFDLRTNKHFPLKENPLKRSDLDNFVACYNPNNRHERKESERFKSFAYEDLLKRDKLNLDILTPSHPLSRPLYLPVCLARSRRLGSGSKTNHSKTAQIFLD